MMVCLAGDIEIQFRGCQDVILDKGGTESCLEGPEGVLRTDSPVQAGQRQA